MNELLIIYKIEYFLKKRLLLLILCVKMYTSKGYMAPERGLPQKILYLQLISPDVIWDNIWRYDYNEEISSHKENGS